MADQAPITNDFFGIEQDDEYRDEKITMKFTEMYGHPNNMTHALRWYGLIQNGLTPYEAYEQVRREFPQ